MSVSTSPTVAMQIRSALFVPGNRYDRIATVLASGADAVIVDLEDAVAPHAKFEAREAVRAFLDATPDARMLVRVNAGDAAEHEADLALCIHSGVAGLLLPKAEAGAAVSHATSICGKPG